MNLLHLAALLLAHTAVADEYPWDTDQSWPNAASNLNVLPWVVPVVIARMDPIVNPGTIGSHVHTVFGASNFRSE